MKTMKSMYIALFGAFLLVAGSATAWAQAAQQTGDQNQSDSSAIKKGKKNKKADAGTSGSKATSDSGTASLKKKSTSKKADAADKSATADSSTAPKKTRSKKSTTSTAADASAAPATAAPATIPVKSKTATPAATPAASTAPVSKPAAAPAAATPASTPAAKTPTTQQTPPANTAGTVWVNTDSGVYHKPGTRWYGKTKQGKYMTEADAAKAGYKASGKN